MELLLHDLREFLQAVRFARPGWLWLSLLPAGLSLVAAVAARRVPRRWERLGRVGAIAGLPGLLRRFLPYLAWTALVLGLAGPRWGSGLPDGVAVGRDVMVVLDLSRSMWAADIADPAAPERWQAAVAGTRELVRTLRPLGGHRVGLVAFAARPVLLSPLTTDYDHVEQILLELDGRAPPAGVRPTDTSTSGTRIGEAILFAVNQHDERFGGAQDIIVITDADDPANDGESDRGITAVRSRSIPLHVAGLGDPSTETLLLLGDVGVPTKLREDAARRLALEGRGEYWPAHRSVPALGEFFREKLHAGPTREFLDDPLPTLRDRSAYFLLAAACLLALGWILPERGI
jgi:Ca-activated chloride channel homolog